MSDTPKLADESKKLLDNAWAIVLFKNDLGSYTAAAYASLDLTGQKPVEITDDFEPSQALYRLTEKVFGNIA